MATRSRKSGSSNPTVAIGHFIFGLVFLGILAYAGLRQGAIIDPQQFFLLRVVAALAAAGVVSTIRDFITVNMKLGKLALRAGGALAIFLVVYKLNPPDLVHTVVSVVTFESPVPTATPDPSAAPAQMCSDSIGQWASKADRKRYRGKVNKMAPDPPLPENVENEIDRILPRDAQRPLRWVEILGRRDKCPPIAVRLASFGKETQGTVLTPTQSGYVAASLARMPIDNPERLLDGSAVRQQEDSMPYLEWLPSDSDLDGDQIPDPVVVSFLGMSATISPKVKVTAWQQIALMSFLSTGTADVQRDAQTTREGFLMVPRWCSILVAGTPGLVQFVELYKKSADEYVRVEVSVSARLLQRGGFNRGDIYAQFRRARANEGCSREHVVVPAGAVIEVKNIKAVCSGDTHCMLELTDFRLEQSASSDLARIPGRR